MQWYKQFPWIHLCAACKKVFCFYYLKCYKTGLITFTERFNTHSLSECHREAVSKTKSLARTSVVDQLNNEANKCRRRNREMFFKVLSSLKYLLRQGLAIRGHKDEESNLYQLLKLRCEDCQELSVWFERHHQYLSHDIINDLITLMGNALLRNLLSKIREANWYGSNC